MKIHDIISESPVQEGVADTLIGAATRAGRAALQNPNAIKAVGGFKNSFRNFGSGTAKPISAVAWVAGKAAFIWKYFGLWQIIQDYNKAIKQAEADLKSGKFSQLQYEADVKSQKAILVAQLVAAFPVFFLAKLASSWTLWTLVFKYSGNVLAQALGKTMGAMSLGAQAYLIQMLRKDEFANWYAKAIAGTGIGDLSQEVYDKVVGMFKIAEEKSKGTSTSDSTTPDASAKIDKDATSTAGTAPASTAPAAQLSPQDAYKQELAAKFKGIR